MLLLFWRSVGFASGALPTVVVAPPQAVAAGPAAGQPQIRPRARRGPPAPARRPTVEGNFAGALPAVRIAAPDATAAGRGRAASVDKLPAVAIGVPGVEGDARGAPTTIGVAAPKATANGRARIPGAAASPIALLSSTAPEASATASAEAVGELGGVATAPPSVAATGEAAATGDLLEIEVFPRDPIRRALIEERRSRGAWRCAWRDSYIESLRSTKRAA